MFRWRPGNDARYKKTIICQEVAKAKNVCQVGRCMHTWGNSGAGISNGAASSASRLACS